MEQFINDTYDTSIYKIEDVEADNKCFYSAVLFSLLANSDLNRLAADPTKIINKSKLNYTFDIERIIRQKNFLDKGFVRDTREYIEKRILAWIKRNRETVYPPMCMTIEEIVSLTHDISFDEYISRDINDIPLWGGLVEQIAVSYYYNIEINIWRAVKYNQNTQKINEGIIKNCKTNKDVRFQLYQKIVPEKILGKPINLLWKKKDIEGDHYMCMFRLT
jgi:hypothetical protein